MWSTDRQTDTRRRLVLLLRTASRAKTKTKVIIWWSHLSALINVLHCKWHAAQKHVASAAATVSNTSSGVSVRHANIALQHYFIILSFYFYSNLIIVGRVAWSFIWNVETVNRMECRKQTAVAWAGNAVISWTESKHHCGRISIAFRICESRIIFCEKNIG